MRDRLNVLTWHVHGNYLWYLSRVPVCWYLPVRGDGSVGYGGRGTTFPFPDNVVEVDAADVPSLDLDVVLYQAAPHWVNDRFEVLSPARRALPAVYLEHDPPLSNPTDTRHHVATPEALVVHVTNYNHLMWDNGTAPAVVIEHGVVLTKDIEPTWEVARGVVVVNHLAERGRRLGADLVEQLARVVPLDVVGMGSEAIGGLGEVPPPALAERVATYRFFFHPARYTSLGLAVIEAMMSGVPVIGLASTELPSVIRDGVDGVVTNDPDRLVTAMQWLLNDLGAARRMGDAGRRTARRRFGIERFVADWHRVLRWVARQRHLIGSPR